jgi:hypothetical protein
VNPEDDNIELVVQVTPAKNDGEHVDCKYYYVDHTARTLFWLHDHPGATEDIFCKLRGVYDPSHIGASCRTYGVTGMN